MNIYRMADRAALNLFFLVSAFVSKICTIMLWVFGFLIVVRLTVWGFDLTDSMINYSWIVYWSGALILRKLTRALTIKLGST